MNRFRNMVGASVLVGASVVGIGHSVISLADDRVISARLCFKLVSNAVDAIGEHSTRKEADGWREQMRPVCRTLTHK